jgi:hypothetical protein
MAAQNKTLGVLRASLRRWRASDALRVVADPLVPSEASEDR